MAKNNTQTPYQASDEPINLYELWMIIWKNARFIVGFCSLSVIVVSIISLFMPKIYMAATSVFPITTKPAINSMVDNNLGFLPFSNIDYDINKIMAVLKSNSLRINVIKKLKLFGIRSDKDIENDNKRYDAVNALNVLTAISHDKNSGIITVTVFHKNPVMARDIANTYISELNILLNTSSLMASNNKLEFLKVQMADVEIKLKKQRDALVRYQKETKIITPGEQTKWTMDLYTQLLSEKLKLQSQLESLETALTSDSTEIRALRNQLSQINSRIRRYESTENMGALPSLSNAPAKLSRYAELVRDLEVTEKFYETMQKMFEQTRFDQAHDGLYVQVIDPAFKPVQRAKPQRRLMVVTTGIGSLFFSIFAVFFMEWYRKHPHLFK